MFEAVILMGGFGTRLKSVSGDTPKPMVMVAGKPFIYHLFEKLEKSGCSRIILSLHYKADEIKETILSDDPVSCELVFVVEKKPLGTGGALKFAAESVLGKHFIALNGDTFCDIDYTDFFEKGVGNDLLLSGVRVADAKRYGSIRYDSESNLTSMTEKGIDGPAVINSGNYCINTSLLKAEDRTVFSLENDFIPRHVGIAKVYIFAGNFIDIGIPEDYFKARDTLR